MSQLKTKWIEDSAVTTPKIANNAVDSSKLNPSVAGDGISGGGGSPLDVDNTVIRTNGANPFIADQSLGNNKLTNVADGTSALDAVNKQQLDTKVTGPASATDEAIVRYDGTTGKLVQNSLVVITDAGLMSGATRLNVDNIQLDGSTISATSGDLTLESIGAGQDIDLVATGGITGEAAVISFIATSASLLLQSSTELTLGAGTNINATNKQIINLADPTSAQHAVTKAYADSIAAGLDPKASVRAATTTALPSVTYNNGTGGVGATLTSTANGALPAQDGITLVVGNRLLVKDQVAALQNGIYTVTQVGNVSSVFILTRATDQDGSPSHEVSGGNFTFVEAGSINEHTGWTVIWDGDITVGTNPIDWTQFSSIGTINAGTGLTRTGSTIDFNTADTSLTVNADDVAVNLNSTGGLETSSGVRIKSDVTTANTIGVTTTSNGAGTKFDSNSFADSGSETLALASGVAGAGLALTTGVLSVNVDNSTIEINSDILRVKAAGITNNEVATGIDAVKIGTGTVDNTEFGYLNGVTSAIQTQLNNRLVKETGDFNHASFSLANNQSSFTNITGLAFANGQVRSAEVTYSITIDATSDLFERGTLHLIQKSSDWSISRVSSGDDSLVLFDVTSSGQLQYTTPNYSGFSTGSLHYRALTTNI